MEIDYQLQEWVNGRCHHNKERDECCPDFSCCQPELLADQDVRIQFMLAWLEDHECEKVYHMLGMFLSAALVAQGDENVRVVRDHPTEQ